MWSSSSWMDEETTKLFMVNHFLRRCLKRRYTYPTVSLYSGFVRKEGQSCFKQSLKCQIILRPYLLPRDREPSYELSCKSRPLQAVACEQALLGQLLALSSCG